MAGLFRFAPLLVSLAYALALLAVVLALERRTRVLLPYSLFIYLFTIHTAWNPEVMAGIERKDY